MQLPFRRPPALENLLKELPETYFVGGCVRDALLGTQAKDIDLEVYQTSPEKLEEILSRHGKVDFVGKAFGVYIFTSPLDGETYEFALPRTEVKNGEGYKGFEITPDPNLPPERAVQRRDFTVNSIMAHAHTLEIFDPTGGTEDLKNRILRPTNARTFSEDPLRVLRAMQIASRLNLEIAPEAIPLAQSSKTEFSSLVNSRIWIEWEKWATKSTKPSIGLKWLKDCGWIEHFPELQALIGVPQDPTWHPEGDAWDHTLYCVDAVVKLPEWQQGSKHEKSLLTLGMLCHDLGKPQQTFWCGEKDTAAIHHLDPTPKQDGGRWRSPGHEAAGITPAKSFLSRIHAPKALEAPICAITAHHMRYLNIPNRPSSETGPTKSEREYARVNAHILAPEKLSPKLLIAAMKADHRGRPPLPGELPEKAQRLLESTIMAKCLEAPEPPLLTGDDILKCGVSPGKTIGTVKTALYLDQLAENFRTREEGLAYFKQNRIQILRRCNACPPPLLKGDIIKAHGITCPKTLGKLHKAAFELQLDGKLTTTEEAEAWLAKKIKALDQAQPQIG